MKKFLQILTVLTLLIWGVLFLHYYLSGRIEKFLDPAFRLYALISGIGMILMGLFNFINRNRDTGVCTHDHTHGEACDHDHHHHEESHDHDHNHLHEHEDTTSSVLFAVFVLIVPVLAASAYSKDKFSGDYLAKWGKIERQMMQMRIAQQREREAATMAAVGSDTNPYTRDGIEGEGTPSDADTPPNNSEGGENEAWGAFTLDDLKQMVPQSDAGDFLLDVPQIFYTAGDRELMEVMEGIPVETTAQLMEETLNNPNNTRLKAFRVFIECCAADARPLSIPIDFGKEPPPYTEMGWYRIFGKLHYLNEADGIYPILKIDKIEETMEPTDGLLY